MHQYIPNTEDEQLKMLQDVGIPSWEALLDMIPAKLRHDGLLDVAPAVSEMEHRRDVAKLTAREGSANNYISFLGAGSYDHFIPHVVDVLASRSEFYTAYTPYQAEVSQGTLQVMYEYQSMICTLTGMDLTNSSMYDGASSLAEACLLASRHTRRAKILVVKGVNPVYLDVAEAYARHQGLIFEIIDSAHVASSMDDDTAAVVVQNPDFHGVLHDLKAVNTAMGDSQAQFIVVTNPISLNLLEAPGNLGADIVVGEGQALGNYMSFGGPYLGFLAVKEPLTRKIPGRIAGETVDIEGKRAFVMVLRTREQDIRRERATSNICTNQGLNALRACIYMSALGKNGMRRVAEMATQKAHYLAEAINALPGFQVAPEPFFNEFVVQCPIPAPQLNTLALEQGFFAGVALGQFEADRPNDLLVAVTEKRTREELDGLVQFLKGLNS